MADEPTTAAGPFQTPLEQPGPKPRRLSRWLALLFLLLVLAIAGIGGYSLWMIQSVRGPASEITVVIPKGSGVRGAAAVLREAGVIDSTTLFLVASKITGADRKLKAGEYRIPPGSTMRGVLDLLRSGKTVVRRFTVAEGLSVRQVDALIRAEPALDGDPGPLPPEGRLLQPVRGEGTGIRRRVLPTEPLDQAGGLQGAPRGGIQLLGKRLTLQIPFHP